MPWTDQNPEANDVVVQFQINDKHFEIDKLSTNRPHHGIYRLTTGNLFGSHEIARDFDVAALLRTAQKAWPKAL